MRVPRAWLALLATASTASGLVTPGVAEVNASDFDPDAYDVIFDVRNLDEYEGLGGGNCSIASVDSQGCSFGHVPGAVWAPELRNCGHQSGAERGACPASEQQLADLVALSGEAVQPPVNFTDYAGALRGCQPLRAAFICYSGVRSLDAAVHYAELLQLAGLSGQDTPPAVSVLGGTRDWFKLGRPTVRGSSPRPWTCKDLAGRPSDIVV